MHHTLRIFGVALFLALPNHPLAAQQKPAPPAPDTIQDYKELWGLGDKKPAVPLPRERPIIDCARNSNRSTCCTS